MVTEGKEAKAQFNFLYNTSASIAAGLYNELTSDWGCGLNICQSSI